MHHRTLSQGCRLIAGCALGLALTDCASTADSAPELPSLAAAPVAVSGRRDLMPEEKKVIMDAVSATIKDPASAKYRWSKFHPNTMPGEQNNYCAIVNAKSSHGPYSGLQAYVVAVQLS